MLLELLKFHGLLRRGRIDRRKVETMPFCDLMDLVFNIVESHSLRADPGHLIANGYAPSLDLSGWGISCSNIECRFAMIDRMSRIGSLLSDKMFVFSYFHRIVHELVFDDEELNEEHYRKETYEALLMVERLIPLIRSGLVCFYCSPAVLCTDCLSKAIFGPNGARRLARSRSMLQKHLEKNIQATLCKISTGYSVSLGQNSDLFGLECHSIGEDSDPDFIQSNPRLMARYESGDLIELSRVVLKRSKLTEHLAGGAVANTLYPHIAVNHFGASFASASPIDLKLLGLSDPDSNYEKRNRILANHLNILVPFLDEIPLKDLISLRAKEGDAFLTFRASVHKAIDEVRGEGRDFRTRDALEVYGDIIEPALSKLNATATRAKKTLVRGPFRSAVGIVGSIAIGLYSGFLTKDLGLVLGSLGAIKYSSDFIQQLMCLNDGEDSIREEKFYFLWKAREQIV